VMQKAEARSVHEDRIIAIAHDIVRVGPAIAPVLVERLAQPKPRPARTQMTLTALGLLDLAADAIIPWLARSTEPVQRAAFCALARQGEAARPALARASTSKKSAERVAAQALLAILDAAEFAPIRETRALRDSLEEPARAEIAASFTTRELPQTLVFEHAARFAWYLRAAAADEQAHPKIGHAVRFADDDCMWAIALLLIETPISSAVSGARETILRGAAQRFGADFGPVADVLLRLPPFADDGVLGALARGKPIPGYEELRAAERRTLDAKNKPAANKKR